MELWKMSKALARKLAVILLLAGFAVGSVNPVFACGLHSAITGGISISHPGALGVTMAVGIARQQGLLPEPSKTNVSNDFKLQRMFSDLRQFHALLGRGGISENVSDPFSLVLVGPGFWSHFHPSKGGLLARFHTTGPIHGQPVVVTHHAVLEVVLRNELDLQQAHKLGLITYSGDKSSAVKAAIESAL